MSSKDVQDAVNASPHCRLAKVPMLAIDSKRIVTAIEHCYILCKVVLVLMSTYVHT